jgi:Zn-dependent metalloprotease
MKIGIEKAGRIWLEALKQFESDMNFRQASREIIAAAAQLYGAKSPETVAVRTAWKVVGL